MNIIRLAESRVVRWFGILSLVVAFIAGEIAARPDHLAQLATYLPSVQLGESEYGSTIFLVENEPDDKEKVVLLGQGEGYGGPLVVAIIASKDNNNGARIDSVHLMSNKETPPYIVRLQKKGFFRDFKNESVSDDFIVGEDLDGFSGATVSARGIAKVVRETVHAGAEKHLKIEPTWHQEEFQFTLKEWGMLALVVAAIAMGYIPNKSLAKKMRLAIPLIALVFVGFYTNSSVSIGSLAAIVMGYIPEPTAHPIWWIMMVSIFAGIIFLGQNIYCNKLCPFSTVQMLLNKITGMNLKVHPKIAKNSALIIKLMIWFSLMLIFLSRHPAMGSYEPFSMMFSLEGMGMQWYILPFSLLGSLFVSDFWCRYFCPVGYSLNEMVRWRRTGMRKVKARFDKPSQAIKVKNITSDSK